MRESTTEFEMLYNGNLEVFTARFEWSAWIDYDDPQDERSEFIDWEYDLIELEYETAEGIFTLEPERLNAMLPEQRHLIDSEIHKQIENEVR
jgi:hypothetical protein